MQFVYQIMNEQVVPEQTAQEHQDVSAGLLFERGNLMPNSGGIGVIGYTRPILLVA